MEGILFLSPSLSSWKLGVLKLELVEPKFIPQHLATTPEDSCLAQPPVFHNISFLSASYSSVTRCHKHFSRGCIKLSKITSAFRAIATTPKIEASSRHLNPISAIIFFFPRPPFASALHLLISEKLYLPLAPHHSTNVVSSSFSDRTKAHQRSSFRSPHQKQQFIYFR